MKKIFSYKTINLKKILKKTLIKKNFLKRLFFLKKCIKKDISFWDMSIFYTNIYLIKKIYNERFLHKTNQIYKYNYILEKSISFNTKNLSNINLDISSQGLDLSQKLFFKKSKIYFDKYIQNNACFFSKDCIKLKSIAHIYLDKSTLCFAIQDLKKIIICIIHHSDMSFVLKQSLFFFPLTELSLDNIILYNLHPDWDVAKW